MRALALATLFLVPTSFAAEPELAQCVLCHGTDLRGNAAIRAPKLAGMERWYVARQLQAFRSGTRGQHAGDVLGSEMRTIALSLSDAAVVRAVEFVAAQKAPTPMRTITGNAIDGAKWYAACATCHGQRGEGNAQLFAPSLTLIDDWYLVAQLNNFRNGLRGADTLDTNAAAMRAAALALPDAQAVLDVAAYIVSLK